MWPTILPELMSVTGFTLTLLCIIAGRQPGYLQDYAILLLDTTGLKEIHNTTNPEIPIHDIYNMYFTTSCKGNYTNGLLPLTDVTCSAPSSYSKFLPGSLIASDLITHHSNETLSSLQFPIEIQQDFNQRFNLQLHVAFIFYIMAVVWLGNIILWGILAFPFGVLAIYNRYLTHAATTFLLISSVIVTVIQKQAVSSINEYGNVIGVEAYHNSKFLALTWSTFAINLVTASAWGMAYLISAPIDNK